jgi:ribosome maturation factor RimP
LSTDIRHQVRALVEPTIVALGFDLVAVEWLTDVRGPILRLSIDKKGGISAENCAKVSRHASQILDEHDPITSSYRLEVSSPGIERPVERLEDFAKFAGFRVRVRLVEGPRKRMTGVIKGVEGDRITVVVDGKDASFLLDAVERAHLVLDLDEYEKIADL